MQHAFYQTFLRKVLSQRCDKNPRYSIRAFAKSLRTDPGSISRILAGKQVPSFKICEKIFASLALSPSEQKKFLASVALQRKFLGLRRTPPQLKEFDSRKETRREVDADIWSVISNWYYGAIMELTYVEGFQSDPRWIAQQLNISELQAASAIQILMDLKLLKMENGKLIKVVEQVASAKKDVTSAAHKRLQRQILEKAIFSLENDEIEDRNTTSMTMAIDPEKIPLAKKLIQDFSRDLCAVLESGRRKQVYQLGVSFFPISKRGDKNEND